MAGFVGYCVQAQGIKFPWEPFASISSTSPPEQWDALPEAAKWQIILGVGFLEWWSELRLEPDAKHYMKGGVPGYIPAFDSTPDQVRPRGPPTGHCPLLDSPGHLLAPLRPLLTCAFACDLSVIPPQLPHWIGLNLWDPFKFTKDLTPAQKQNKLLAVRCPGPTKSLSLSPASLRTRVLPGCTSCVHSLGSAAKGYRSRWADHTRHALSSSPTPLRP
jgi:hypothetical protein